MSVEYYLSGGWKNYFKTAFKESIGDEEFNKEILYKLNELLMILKA